MRSISKSLIFVLAAPFLVMMIATRAPAQVANDDADWRRRCEPTLDLERSPCESAMAAPDNPAATPGDVARAEAQLRMAQVREDLGYLRLVTGYLSHTAAQGGELDFKAIAKRASEIRKRANRLKDNLLLPDPQKSAKYRKEKFLSDAGELRAALSSLSSLISDAAGNPVLRGHLLDLTMSVKARRELDEIVELSELIKASSEMSGKAGQ